MLDEVFTDSYIMGKVHSRKFLTKLEGIIEDDREHLSLIGLKAEEPGEKIDHKKIMRIYRKAKKEVDEFFGVRNIKGPIVNEIDDPTLKNLGEYYDGTKKSPPNIFIYTLQRNYVKPILIHEYTHHLSVKISRVANNESRLYEGLSLSMEYELAGQINKSECNSATIDFVLHQSIGYLKDTFAYADNFLSHKKSAKKTKRKGHLFSGYAVLRIAEKKFGAEILRDVLFRRSEKLMDAFESEII